MKFVSVAVIFLMYGQFSCLYAVAAVPNPAARRAAAPAANFHAGLHSGSWTLERKQLLEQESQDPHRSCADPYCARCAKHLADYGHEYQYLDGPRQRQLWYRGTAGSVAVTTQRGYDQHGYPYLLRGMPAAIISAEYLQTLNHAIWEQVNARNAVAVEEAAQDRVVMLKQLLTDASEQLRLTKNAWEEMERSGIRCVKVDPNVSVGEEQQVPVSPCAAARKKNSAEFIADMTSGRHESSKSGLCCYCLARERFLFDQTYVAGVVKELEKAECDLRRKSAAASEAVRIALLSKDDADRATRFKRLQHKPPKYQEVLAAQNEAESAPPAAVPPKTKVPASADAAEDLDVPPPSTRPLPDR